MMDLNYTKIHHSCKIHRREQPESMVDRRYREISTKGLHKNTEGNWEATLPIKTDTIHLSNNKGTVWEGYCHSNENS